MPSLLFSALQNWHFSGWLLLCFMGERRSYGFEMTLGYENNNISFSLKAECFLKFPLTLSGPCHKSWEEVEKLSPTVLWLIGQAISQHVCVSYSDKMLQCQGAATLCPQFTSKWLANESSFLSLPPHLHLLSDRLHTCCLFGRIQRDTMVISFRTQWYSHRSVGFGCKRCFLCHHFFCRTLAWRLFWFPGFVESANGIMFYNSFMYMFVCFFTKFNIDTIINIGSNCVC